MLGSDGVPPPSAMGPVGSLVPTQRRVRGTCDHPGHGRPTVGVRGAWRARRGGLRRPARSATGRLGVHRADTRRDPREQRAGLCDQGRPPHNGGPLPAITGLDQKWGVFAPNPRIETSNVVGRVERADGTLGDYPLESGAGISEYWNYRWRKYGEQLWTRPTAEPERVAFARWIARRGPGQRARAGARDTSPGHPAEPATRPGPRRRAMARNPVLHDAGRCSVTAPLDAGPRGLGPLLVHTAVHSPGRALPHRLRDRRDRMDVLAHPDPRTVLRPRTGPSRYPSSPPAHGRS